MAYDIFISYRRKGGGSERAQLLNARFLLAGYKEDDIFIDVSTIPPGNYRDIITTALEVTNNFVVVMFPGCFDNVSREDSNATDIEKIDDCYVYEIAKALQLGKNVIPVLFDGFDFNKERLPSVLSGLAFSYQNAVVYSRDYPKASFDKLLEFVKPRPNIPPIPKLSIWNKVRDYVKSHKKVLTITISISMAVVLLIPTIGLLNSFSSPDSDVEVIFSSPDSDVEAIQSRPSPGLIEQSDTISTQKISSSETTTYTVKGVSFDMVSVAGGTFTMGATSEQGSEADSDEKPTHKVTLSDYMIGKTEVTQELWQAVMGSNPSNFKGNNLPVENVSWHDCQEFIKKLNSLTGLNFRLPTEAEWEYAARGGNKSKGYKYSGRNDIGSVAWYEETTNDSGTKPVATKASNELGLYDMSGNVWEWCSDWNGSYNSGSQTNPKGPSSGSSRVFRGGSWDSNAGYCRVSYRYYGGPGSVGSRLGLRLAL